MFICEPIEVEFEKVSGLLKKPGPPLRFVWREQSYTVAEILMEWMDYGGSPVPNGRRPRYFIRSAQHQGSWGIGRQFYRVRAEEGGEFVIYYDRHPTAKGIDSGWFMYEAEETDNRP
jgi:hypothetical protein